MPARSIGAVNLNDHVNTWWDRYDPPYTRIIKYASPVNRGGLLIPVRRDLKAAVIVCYLRFFDTDAMLYKDFLAALEAVDGGALILGDGTEYQKCDVTGVMQSSIVKGMWQCSITVQSRLATRISAP